MTTYYCENQLAIINLETLFPEGTPPGQIPDGIHPLAERAVHLLGVAHYHEMIFLWPHPMQRHHEALAWLKKHELRERWSGGMGETRALYSMSAHFQTDYYQEHGGLFWLAAMCQELIVDRHILKQVVIVNNDPQVCGWTHDIQVPCLANCLIWTGGLQDVINELKEV